MLLVQALGESFAFLQPLVVFFCMCVEVKRKYFLANLLRKAFLFCFFSQIHKTQRGKVAFSTRGSGSVLHPRGAAAFIFFFFLTRATTSW